MLRILAFGDLEVDVDGHRVALPGSQRIRSLLAWLALHPGSHPRARVAATLWPDVPDANAKANLRSALWSFALGPR